MFIILFFILNVLQATEINPYDVVSHPEFSRIASSVAAMVPKDRMTFEAGAYQAKFQTMLEKNICEDNPFAHDKTLSRCSGALITNKHILTAGHCFHYIKNACRDHYWVFDYQDESGKFQESQVYGCKDVIAQNYSEEYVVPDYAIIELDREVRSRQPITISSNEFALEKTEVYSLSYPLGKPLHLSDRAQVNKNTEVKDNVFFWSDLVTYNASSGAPVLNHENQIVGIVASGATIIIENKEKNCKDVVDIKTHFSSEELKVFTGSTNLKPVLKIIKRKKLSVNLI